MEIKKIRGAIEAILFASGDAVSTDRVAQVLSLGPDNRRQIDAECDGRF